MAAFKNTPWRWISGILGVLCLLLMATLGTVLKNYKFFWTYKGIEPIPSSRVILESQEDSGYHFCQERWIGYQCNCYFISRELKTWNESRNFCASQNSTLLQIHSRDEIPHFMNFTVYFFWIEVTHSEEHGDWVERNYSAVSQDLLSFPKKCIAYSMANGIWDEPCESKNFYICKKQLI